MSAYEEVGHCWPDVLMIPFGKGGKSFVSELAKLRILSLRGSVCSSFSCLNGLLHDAEIAFAKAL